MELSGTGSWGTFFSDKIYMIGANYAILFDGNKAEYFDYTNSADAADFWNVVTYYAQNSSHY